MNNPLIIIGLAGLLVISLLLLPTSGATAVPLCLALATLVYFVIRRSEDDAQFLVRLFIGALLVRVLIGTLIYALDWHEFFGGDSLQYDYYGNALLMMWRGYEEYQQVEVAVSGYGMLYLVAAIYSVTGRNMLAIQYFNSVIGAATAPIIYMCAVHMFGNKRVARTSAVLVAFYPSLVLWSSQGLKDGPIVFLLALSMLAILKLGDKLSMKYLVILLFSMMGVLSLRFYVFYMLAAAVVGAFVIGMQKVTSQGLVRQVAIVGFVGLSLTYFGVLRTASTQIDNYANLDRIQNARSDLAQTANSGFGQDVDVSTTTGALSAIPIGMTYLLFAPFPWQMASLRQSITLPEMLLWWGSFPLLVMGLWFTIKYRLRQALPILIFTSMLTLAYSVMQGNIGTAYRQRAQLLVFYFIFVAVGYILLKERNEDRRLRAEAAKRMALEARAPRRDLSKEAEWKASAETISRKLGL